MLLLLSSLSSLQVICELNIAESGYVCVFEWNVGRNRKSYKNLLEIQNRDPTEFRMPQALEQRKSCYKRKQIVLIYYGISNILHIQPNCINREKSSLKKLGIGRSAK